MNKKCQVFTPSDIVDVLLDRVEYTTNIYGKKVIENACGDGNILREIVRRYIIDSLNRNIKIEDIRLGLELDIYGIEIDRFHYLKCIENLNQVAAGFEIYNVTWKIMNTDILKTELEVKFDYVVGNPPYIAYQDLDEETRAFVKEHYDSCFHGKFDYCYAFIEASIKCLNDKGKISYLVPSNIFKNVFANKLREMMLPYLTRIYDYTVQKLFDKALTSSAILIFDKVNVTDEIEYFDISKGESYSVSKKDLGGKWIFSQFRENRLTKKIRFSDYFTASMGVATLLNEAFILKGFKSNEKYIIVDDNKIEIELVHKAASPRSLNYGRCELIIFPYYYREGKLVRYSSEEFESNFPKAAVYIKKFIKKLEKRKSDKSVKWFEYGRTQALAHLNQDKLLTSTVVTKHTKVYELSKEYIPYSGIYITTKGQMPLSVAKSILESQSFFEYVKVIGTNASGSSMRITAVDINNFEFQLI